MPQPMPDKTCFVNALSLATTLNSNNYMREKLNAIFDSNHVEKPEKLNQGLDVNTEIVKLKSDSLDHISTNAFLGKATLAQLENIKTGAVNFIEQTMIAEKQDLSAEVIMYYSVDDTSQFVRGYKINGQIISDETANEGENATIINTVDKLFQAWLVSRKMGSDAQGRIHRRSEAGVLSEKVIPASEVKVLMEDRDLGVIANIKAKQLTKIDLKLSYSPSNQQEETPSPF